MWRDLWQLTFVTGLSSSAFIISDILWPRFYSLTDPRAACLAWWKINLQTTLFKKWSMLPKLHRENFSFSKYDLMLRRWRSTRTENTFWQNSRNTWSSLAWSTRHLVPRCYNNVIFRCAIPPVGDREFHLKGYPQVGQCVAIDLHCVQGEYSSIFYDMAQFLFRIWNACVEYTL